MEPALAELHQLATRNTPNWVCLLDTRPGGIFASAQLTEDLRSLGCEARHQGRQIWFRLPSTPIEDRAASPRDLIHAG